MKTVSVEDALRAVYDPGKAFTQISSEINMHICEFYINEKIFISAFYARQIIDNAKEYIIEIFKNFAIIDFNEDKFLNITTPKSTIDMTTGFIKVMPHSKVVNAEKINKIKGLFDGDIEILRYAPNFNSDDIFICNLDFHTFLYIVAKLNSILYYKNIEFKKFFDSLEILKKQGFPFDCVDKKYEDCFLKNYDKHIENTNKALTKISDFRNLKISQQIKRNSYIAGLNKAIEYTFSDNNLSECKDILIYPN